MIILAITHEMKYYNVIVIINTRRFRTNYLILHITVIVT